MAEGRCSRITVNFRVGQNVRQFEQPSYRYHVITEVFNKQSQYVQHKTTTQMNEE